MHETLRFFKKLKGVDAQNCGFISYADKIKGLLDKMEYLAEGTRTDKALRLADQLLFTKEGGNRPDAHDILIVVTDGKTNPIHSEPYEKVLAPLKVIFYSFFG